MITTTTTIGASPSWDQYCDDNLIAGSFVNRVLYRMCKENPGHDDPIVTAGKIDAIGRIYAASPERGAGTEGLAPVTVVRAIAERLAKSNLDDRIRGIDFGQRISPELRTQVSELHKMLVDEIVGATGDWSKKNSTAGWKPRRHDSFASKYLHFHRPNAFPIMDKFAKNGLLGAGERGAFGGYKSFCRAFLKYAEKQGPNWTPRSLDPDLVEKGRQHLDHKALQKKAQG